MIPETNRESQQYSGTALGSSNAHLLSQPRNAPSSQQLPRAHRETHRSDRFANPPTSYRSLSGPPGPKSPKSLKKVSRGKRPRGPKKSGKSLEKVRKVWKKSRKCLFGTFSRLFPDFWGPRGRRPRETFFRLFGDFGPGGPERLL